MVALPEIFEKDWVQCEIAHSLLPSGIIEQSREIKRRLSEFGFHLGKEVQDLRLKDSTRYKQERRHMKSPPSDEKSYRELDFSFEEIRNQPTEQGAVDYVRDMLLQAGFDLDRPMEKLDYKDREFITYKQEA